MRFFGFKNKIRLVALLIFVSLAVSPVNAATAPNLGAADSFSVLGFSNVTNTNLTTLSGDIGVWSGSSITGLGSITVGGATHITDSVAQQAQSDASTADGNLLGQANTGGSLGALDSLVLVPGVYDLGAGSLSGGVLTLNGAGVYIFRTTSSLVSAGSINLINGARACDVFWHVESAATINGTSFVGTIIAKTGVHFGTGVVLDGRALAIGADVTMDTNNISGPSCASTTPTPTPTPTSTSNSTSTSSNSTQNNASETVYCPPINDQIITPLIMESKRIDANSISIKWGPYSGTDKFNIQYGFEKEKLLYNTDVIGFSTTINALHSNQPIWVRVAARNDCQIGTYGELKLVGGPGLPNTGMTPNNNNILKRAFASIATFVVFLLKLTQN